MPPVETLPSVETLPPDVQSFITEAVAGGRYSSITHVLSEGVRLLQERDRRLRDMREAVKEGYRSLEEGEPTVIRSKSDLRNLFNGIRRETGLPERTDDD